MSRLHSFFHNPHKFRQGLLFVLIVLSIIAGFWVTQWRIENADTQMRQQLLLQVTAIAQSIKPEQTKLLTYTLADRENPIFQRLHNQMKAYATTFGYRSIYTMVLENQQIVFGPDSIDLNDPLYLPPGSVYKQPPPQLKELFQKPQKIIIGPYKDEYGEFITAYAPILTPRTREVAMVVAMDLEKAQWQREIDKLKLAPLLFTLSFLALILGSEWILKNRAKFSPLAQIFQVESYLTFAFGILLTVAIALLFQENQLLSRQRTFAQMAETRAATIAGKIRDIRDNYILNLARFFETSEQVTRTEFAQYSREILNKQEIEELRWISQVQATEKERFEQRARQEGLENFSIFQLDSQGRKIPATGRDVYYPVFYVEPLTENKVVLGYDLSSESLRQAALLEAITTKLPTATEVVTPIYKADKQLGLFVYQAVFKDEGNLLGLVGILIRSQDILSETLTQSAYGDSSVYVDWLEAKVDQSPEILASFPPNPRSLNLSTKAISYINDEHSSIYPVFAFGKAYAILLHPGSAFLESNPLDAGWLSGLVGLTLTTMVTAIVNLITSQRLLLKQQVEVRTAELRETSEQLQERVKEMRCLVALSQLSQEPDLTRERLLQQCVELLPPAWQYPEHTCARLCYQEEVYKTPNYAPSPWGISAEVVVNHNPVGVVEVYLREHFSFLKEEEILLNAVARFLARFLERQETEEALSKSEQRFRHISALTSDIAYSCIAPSDGYYALDWLTGAVKTITGYEVEEIISRGCWGFLVIEEDLPLFQESVVGLEPGFSASCQLRLRHKNGQLVWVNSFAECLADSDNPEITRLYGALIDITEHKLAEAIIKQSERNYREIFNSTNEAIFIQEIPTGKIVDVNQSMLQIYGYANKEEVIADHIGNFSINEPPHSQEEAKEYIRKAIQEGTQVFEWLAKRRNGEAFWVEVSLRASEIGGERRLLAVVRDISERKQQEQQIKHLTRLYATLSQINQAIVRYKEHEPLFQAICEVGVTFGQFALVWIGLIDSDNKTLVPIAYAGLNTDYLQDIHISVQDIPSGRGPTGIAAREGRLVLCEDIVNDPRMAPWRDKILKYGYRSSAAVPIKQGGQVIGVLNFYSHDLGFFTEEEQRLLEEIASDIALALDAIQAALEYRQAEQKLQENEQRLRLALKAANQGLYDLNIQTGETIVSPEYATMLGYDPNQFQETNAQWIERLHPEDRQSVAELYRAYIRGEIPSFQVEFRQRMANGDWKWILSLGKVVEWDALGKPLRMLGTHTDISERKKAEGHIEYLAYYDPLTELPNRRLLFDRLENAIYLTKRSGKYGALLFIDLDRFKTLNDARGHEVGDRLLKEVALRLKDSLRHADTVARFGGDEFVVILPQLADDHEVAARLSIGVAEKICINVSNSFVFDGEEIIIGASIGITLFSKGTETINDVLKEADTAMYQAKASGRNTARLFETKMQLEVESRFALEGEIRHALELNQFLVYLQPQVDGNGTVVGAEALIRWQHPSKGMIPPSAFIPVAEETGQIIPIGDWVLLETCNYLARIQAGGSLLHLSVNVSPRQFRQPTFIPRLKTILATTGADPNRLTLEVTEGLIMDDIHQAIATMSELQTLGIHFSIDDFGTGYSSLAYLKRLPLNELKIDKSFVQDAPRDPNDAALVEAIIAIARHFNLDIVAEGVETMQQAEFLKARGCDFYQGYLYGKPIPMSEFKIVNNGG